MFIQSTDLFKLDPFHTKLFDEAGENTLQLHSDEAFQRVNVCSQAYLV